MATLFSERTTRSRLKRKFGGMTPESSFMNTSPPRMSIFVIMRQCLGSLYPTYSNEEKERFVCRPSRVHGIHDGYDKKKQAVKMTDVFGIEVWGALYESCRQHGDFVTKRSND